MVVAIKQGLWQILCTQLKKTPSEKRQIGILLGFLSACAKSDPHFYNSTLDNLVDDEVFGEWFPIFQTTSTIDKRGVERLHEALDTGKAKIDTFNYLAWGVFTNPLVMMILREPFKENPFEGRRN